MLYNIIILPNNAKSYMIVSTPNNQGLCVMTLHFASDNKSVIVIVLLYR